MSEPNTYRVVSRHVESLSCGQMLDPGETSNRVDLSNPNDKALLDDGKLVLITEAKIDATEAAVERAEELGIDLRSVTGTGSGGRITLDDIPDEQKKEDD